MKRTTPRTKTRKPTKTEETLLAHSAALRMIDRTLTEYGNRLEEFKTIRNDLANNTCRAAWGVTITQDVAAVKQAAQDLRARIDTRNTETRDTCAGMLEKLAKAIEQTDGKLGDHIDGTGAALQRTENRLKEREQRETQLLGAIHDLRARLATLETQPAACVKPETGKLDQTRPAPRYYCPKCHSGMDCYGPSPEHHRCTTCGGSFYP
jgi:chromosome segregation ATPase